ncbi:4-phosphoerythronate dehydrogenase [Spongiibacter sp. KMU-158]|uniref:Erythronate-4-phosphate dehydrogenase n=1 Tax=Spongiibacter pelagi TaxID=2760804 RepID=A0A927GWD8_9GAMM|nr:4-phosphoerythronate dehydrogenase [Spongiibacter pelagi]MBD2859636.1 4-phosphoerythronate dehydrogenase [Spongiibacter pelagi]
MRILVDENIPAALEAFSQFGEVQRVPGRQLGEPQWREVLASADAIMVRSVTRVNRELLQGTNIRYVGSATIGADHLDTTFLEQQGIAWSTAPGCNADSVGDFVLSAMAVCGDILERLLAGGRLGVIGHGNVGQRLTTRMQRLGISCLAYDPLIAQQGILTSLDSVLQSDMLCLHAPLTRSGNYPTFHLLSFEQLCRLPEGAVLLSAGRGEVVSTEVLLALAEKRPDITQVLDVWEPEPAIPLALLEKVFLATPHIAGYSSDGKLNGTRQIAQWLALQLNQSFSAATVDAVLPPADEITLVSEAPSQLIREAILAIYDVREDDARLRQALSNLKDDAERGRAFDVLRKTYPLRRELGSSSLSLRSEQADLASLLNALQGRGEK